MRWTAAILLAPLLVLLGACSSDESSDSTSSATAAPSVSSPAPTVEAELELTTPAPDDTEAPVDTEASVDAMSDEEMAAMDDAAAVALDHVDATLAADGTLPLDAALSMFAATFRPLPGVTPSDFRVVEGGPIVRRIATSLDELTTEQRVEFEDFLGIADAVPLDEIPDGGGGSSAARPRRDPIAEALPIIDDAIGRFNGKLSMALPPSFIEVVALPRFTGETENFSSALNGALATGLSRDGGGTAFTCLIRLNEDATVDTLMFRSQVSHEVFHCFHNYILGLTTSPLWIVEGGAGWVGEDFAGGTSMSLSWWDRWLEEPERAINARSYDGIGAFALANRKGLNVHQLIIDMIRTPSWGTYRAAVGDDSLDLWGSHEANDPDWGDAYTLVGPGAPRRGALLGSIDLVVDGGAVTPREDRTDPGTSANPLSTRPPGDVLRVTGASGLHGSLRFADGVTATLASSEDYCLRDGGCLCPEGSPGGGPTTTTVGDRLFVGIGPSDTGGPTFEALSLERWCGQPAAAAPVDDDTCIVGSWRSSKWVGLQDPSRNETITGGGGVLYDFRSDGTVSVSFSAMDPVVTVIDAPEGQRYQNTLTFIGAGEGTYVAAGGTLTSSGFPAGALSINLKSEIVGVAVVADNTVNVGDVATSGTGASVGSGSYECDSTTLRIFNAVPEGRVGFEFTRG